jgi:predicted GNAT family N-acyltransferase
MKHAPCFAAATCTSLHISPATSPAALSRCHALRKRVFVDELGVPSSLEFDEHDALPGPSVAHLLAADGPSGTPLGTCRVRTGSEHKGQFFGAKLERFCVDKDARRSGIGAALVSVVEELYADLDGPLFCYAKRESRLFYERVGWEVESELFVTADVEHFAMVRRRLPVGVEVARGRGHVAFRTHDIERARMFYGLLGFRDESRFLVSGHRAAWIQVRHMLSLLSYTSYFALVFCFLSRLFSLHIF